MIQIQNLTKSYRINGGRHYVFRDVSTVFPDDANIGILGPNGGGKSTFLRLLGGIDHPDSGRILSNHTFSWPLGLKGGFVYHLSGRENCRMICNLYGLSSDVIKRKLEEIKELSGIGKYFEESVDYYSSGMSGRLGFALSMSFDFDYFLIDEITSVGDANFKALAKKTLEEKAKRSKVIMVSHSMGDLKKFCDVAVVISDGGFRYFDKLDDAIRAYLPQPQKSARDADEDETPESADQTSLEEIHLDSIELPSGKNDFLADIEQALASIEEKLALPTHRLPKNETFFFFHLATVYEKLGNRAKALTYYERSAQHNPYHLRTQLKLAGIALLTGDHAALDAALASAEQADPQNAKVLDGRTRQHLQTGALDTALSTNDTALRLSPEDPEAWHLRAQIFARQKRLDEAVSAQTKAIHFDPKTSAYYTALSSLLAQNGDFKTSQQAAHKAYLLGEAEVALPPYRRLSRVANKLNRLLKA